MTYRESAGRPFYSIDSDNDDEVLLWLNSLYTYRSSDAEEIRRIEKQTTHLALYLNYSPVHTRAFTASSSGSLRVFERRDYYHLIDPLIKGIVNQWTDRLASRKPSFTISPKNYSDPIVKSRADKAKAVLDSKFQEQDSIEIDEQNIRNNFIFGESYLEIFWNPNKGPLDSDIQKYLDDQDSNSDDTYESLGGDYTEQIRIGDVDFRLHDPRNIIVQRARSYKDAEWVLILEAENTECMKARYPDYKDDIVSSAQIMVFGTDVLSPSYEQGQTVLMKLYHRPTLEVPHGCIIEATPEVILSKKIYPSKKWIKKARFPVLQMADLSVLGSSRGAASTIMDASVYGQIALNNLWIQALTNLATYSPKLLVQKGSLDMNQMRVTDRNILTYGKSQAKPELMSQEVVSQGHLLLIDKLRDRILKNANVSPPSVGDTIPNAESRQMLDFYKDQESLSSISKDAQHYKFLKDWATLTLELISDKYSKDEQRHIQYFGKQKKFNEMDIKGGDLDVDVDIYIDNISALNGTLDGRLKKVQSILQVVPGYYTPMEIIDILDIASPEKAIDEITGAVENTRREIHDILLGKKVAAPTKTRDLITAYDIYMQEIQKPEIQDLLPEIYSPGGKTTGEKLLDQVATIEMLLMECLDRPMGATIGANGQPVPLNMGDSPVFAPQFNMPPGTTFKQYLLGRHPTFPCVFNPDVTQAVDPMVMMSQGTPPLGGPPSSTLPMQGDM